MSSLLSEIDRTLIIGHFRTAVGLAAVKLALLQQEALEIQQGTVTALDDTVSHSVLISMGLDLEEQQYVVVSCYCTTRKSSSSPQGGG